MRPAILSALGVVILVCACSLFDETEPMAEMKIGQPTFAVSCTVGTDVDTGSVEIWNEGDGTLRYFFYDSWLEWLKCLPDEGSSEGEKDTIRFIYDTEDLAPGVYAETLEVRGYGAGLVDDGEVWSSPQYLLFHLTVYDTL